MHIKEINIKGFSFEDITGAISVAYPIVSFFLVYYPKKGSFRISGLIKLADILGIKFDATN